MTNMRLKNSSEGYVILATSLILLMVLTLVALFAGQSLSTEGKIAGNTYRSQQAFEAAQAGLEYGINFATTNKSTITDGQVLTGTLSNSSTYSVVLNFVGGNNTKLNIVSTGTCADGSASRIVKQIVKNSSSSITLPPNSVVSRGNVTLKNNASVSNTLGATTILTGGTVVINNNAQTVLASGVSSTSSSTKSDVVQNNSALAGTTDTGLQTTYAGMAFASFSALAGSSYSGTGSQDYSSSVSGQTGKIIYINQGGSSGTVTTSNGLTIGSAANPVIVVVNGNLSLGNNLTIYGNLYVTGDINIGNNSTINGLVFGMGNTTVSQNVTVNGAVVSGGTTTFAANNIVINYNPTVLGANNQIGGNYGKVNGSWQDMNL